MKKLVIVLLLLSQIVMLNAYGDDPHNIVYNNAPAGSEGSTGALCMAQLASTQNELDKNKYEKDTSIREMIYMKEKENGRISPLVWTVVGILAGGAAGYAAFHK